MIFVDIPERIFAVAWSFQVAPENREDFERAYGPNGDWVRLFRTAHGYIRTELHRDPENPGTYITLDFWRSREQYEVFKQHASAAYAEIDAKCESLTDDECLLGEFEAQESLRAAVGVEDWGTIRMLCAECSRGNPGPHSCESSDQSMEKAFAFAARSEEEVRSILDIWAREIADADYDESELVLAAEM